MKPRMERRGLLVAVPAGLFVWGLLWTIWRAL